MKNIVREVINLVVTFFKSIGLKDEIFAIPENVKWLGIKVAILKLGMTLIALIFAFMLKLCNLMIEHRLILLGIILFMLHRAYDVVRDAMYLFNDSESEKLRLIFEDEIVLRGSQIIGKTANRVMKFDKVNNLYKLMSNESVLNTIKNYLKNVWMHKIRHSFDIIQMISLFAMLIVAVLTNDQIDQAAFIVMIVIFVVISFFSSAFIRLSRDAFYKQHREYNDEQSLIVNDLLRVPFIVNQDLEMRLSKFQQSVTASNKNIMWFHKKYNFTKLFETALGVASQYGIIICYLLAFDWSTITLATITEITATLLIVETALSQISQLADTLNSHNERVTIIEKEEPDMISILHIYYTESTRKSVATAVDSIEINPFVIQYLEESENDRPFTLLSKLPLHFKRGEVIILYGPSGSGKSTFMKMLTDRIRLEKSTEIPATSRFLYYDETLTFGSLTIYEELFCGSQVNDLAKMQMILDKLHLWSEIGSNCIDVWKWMQEKQFEQSLLNGQKQRLILAKMMYWLDDEIDVLVLDECTSGLDDKSETDSADAERILEFIVRYANMDKQRIVIISTHQNVDGFKHNLEWEFSFRNLQFSNADGKNYVEEI